MKRLLLLLASALLPAVAHADPDDYTAITNGRALAAVGDCAGCHGPQLAGGLALRTPFGVISTPNLTPDDATGIGLWSADDFYRAMHDGIARGGVPLYPAFPYPYYTRLTRQDVDDIYTYLRTLPPVQHQVDRNTLPFPFDIRALMRGWNALYFKPGAFQADTAKSAAYNRGAYLVEGAGHCGACHTPMDWAGANDNARALQGNELAGFFGPNITGTTRIGVGAWSEDDIVDYLRDGRNAHSQAIGPMAEVVTNSTSHMNEADLQAIATYLKQRAAGPPPAPKPIAGDDAAMRAGADLYVDNCSACHTRDGRGIPGMFPPLAGSAMVQQNGPSTLIRMVMEGAQGAATDRAPTAPAMPAFRWRLSDTQVAAVLTYVRNSWGNAAPALVADDAKDVRAHPTIPEN